MGQFGSASPLTPEAAGRTIWGMHDRSRKRPRDLNQLAASIVDEATSGEGQTGARHDSNGKNPHAAALGRLGGLKGGRARAANLTPEQRSEAARRAAAARWGPSGS